MTRLMLDTRGYSALSRAHPGISAQVREATEIHVNPVVLGELLFGFSIGRYRRKNEDELRAFLGSPRVSLDLLDSETASRYAVLAEALRRAGTPIPTNDVWIVAGAMQHGLRVVTTDAHFRLVPQILADVHGDHGS